MTYLPSATEAKRRRDAIREIANRLDDATIDELLRRAKEPSGRDGWPTSTMGGGSNGGNVSNPTLNAVAANAGGREADHETGEPATADTWADQANDPVYDAICGIFAQLAEATGVLRAVDRSVQYAKANPRMGRVSTISDCLACELPVTGAQHDRIRSGYCPACYMAWMRGGYEDRPTFERSRRQQAAS